MFKSVSERFNLITGIFEKNNYNTNLIISAYDFANKMHKNQLRKDGLPYISHPVEVALILAELGFDEDVVAGALLHDVVEDCGCTVQQLSTMFNKNVAQMVDCVSSIDKEKYVFNNDDLFEDPLFPKASIEEQSFKKLILIGKQNPKGFCIKFADRLHNLRTISCFDYNKQLEKVKETEKWILPIAKILHSNYFYQEIKNECFKILYKNQCSDFIYQCNNYFEYNKNNINNILKNLNEILKNIIKLIKYTEVKEYKIFENLKSFSKTLTLQQVSQGNILKVSNYNIYLLYSEENYAFILNQVINIINNNLKSLKIIDVKTDDMLDGMHLVVEDELKNKYNLFILSVEDYSNHHIGSLTKQYAELMDDNELDDLDKELIKVKTRSEEIKYIQKGSTVLDFAFKIHKDIGFSFKYAIINNSKTKHPPYTKLLENDKVEIVTEKDDKNNLVNTATMKWFAYVNTDLAKKCLIKHFEKKI